MSSVFRTIQQLRDFIQEEKNKNHKIAIVPTMGFLHDAHISLVNEAHKHAQCVILTIYVNPTQFGPNEDFASYPRDEAHDIELCNKAGVHAVFIPKTNEIYPNGQNSTWVTTNNLDKNFCAAFRPGHFNGVTTIVSKLLIIAEADFACFGEKDYQQLRIISTMTQDLCLKTKIIPCPTLRENDGLALSSRNIHLTPEQRKQAPLINQALIAAKNKFQQGCRSKSEILKTAKDTLAQASLANIQYIDLANPQTLEILDENLPEQAIILTAVKFDNTRLIDNRILH